MSKKTGEPLKAYEYAFQAESAAEHTHIVYGHDLTPYECQKCSNWHLSPKSRNTPSRTCEFCTDSWGSNKQLYRTEPEALARALIIEKEKHIHLRVYECPYQSGWHLTKQ